MVAKAGGGNRDIRITISGDDLTAPMYASAKAGAQAFYKQFTDESAKFMSLWDQQLARQRQRINENLKAEGVVRRARVKEEEMYLRQADELYIASSRRRVQAIAASEKLILFERRKALAAEEALNARAAYMREFGAWRGRGAATIGGGGMLGIGGMGAFNRFFTGAAAYGAMREIAGDPVGGVMDFMRAGRARAEGRLTEDQKATADEFQNLQRGHTDFFRQTLANAFNPSKQADESLRENVKSLFPSDVLTQGIADKQKTIERLQELITPEARQRDAATLEAPLLAMTGEKKWGLLTDRALRAFEDLSRVHDVVEMRVEGIEAHITRLETEQDALRGLRFFNRLGGRAAGFGLDAAEAGPGMLGFAKQTLGVAANRFGRMFGGIGEFAGRNFEIQAATLSPGADLRRQFDNLTALSRAGRISPESAQELRRDLFFKAAGGLPTTPHNRLSAVESRFLTRGADVPQMDQLQLAVAKQMAEDIKEVRRVLENEAKKGGLEVEVRRAR